MTAHLTESKLQCPNCTIHRLRRYLCNLWKTLWYTSRHAEEKSSGRRNHCWSGANELCTKAGNQPEESDCEYQRCRQTRCADYLPAGALSLAVLLSNRRYPALQTGRNYSRAINRSSK